MLCVFYVGRLIELLFRVFRFGQHIFSHANELIANFLKKEATLECVFDRCIVL